MYKIAYETFNDYVTFFYKQDGTWTNKRSEAYVFTDWLECDCKLSEINATRPKNSQAFTLDKRHSSYSNVVF